MLLLLSISPGSLWFRIVVYGISRHKSNRAQYDNEPENWDSISFENVVQKGKIPRYLIRLYESQFCQKHPCFAKMSRDICPRLMR